MKKTLAAYTFISAKIYLDNTATCVIDKTVRYWASATISWSDAHNGRTTDDVILTKMKLKSNYNGICVNSYNAAIL